VLQVGNGAGSGNIPTNIVINAGALAYNLTNNYTQAGTIACTNSSVNITNLATLAGSSLVLTMADGTNTFASIINKSGTLVLTGSANSTNTVATASLNSSATTTLRIDGGTWSNTPALVMTAGGTLLMNGGTLFAANMRSYVGNLTISNGTLNAGAGNRLSTSAAGPTFIMAGGIMNIGSSSYGFRWGDDNNGATSTSFACTNVQYGGTINILNGGNSTCFNIGGTSANVVSSYTLLGGILNCAGDTGANGALAIGADTAGTSTTTFTLGGGKLIVSGSTPGYNQNNLAGAQTTGTPKQVFNWTNGILVAGACTMTNLQSVAGGAYGTLTNSGGTLAPGDIGTPGKTIIIGNYGQGSGGTLAIDIGGTTNASAFTNSGGYYDMVAVTANATLGGSLSVSLINGFVPAATNSFTILTNGGTLSMAFTNLTAGNRVTLVGNPNATFLVVTTATKVILTNYTVAVATTNALTASANPSVYGQSVTFTATLMTNGVTAGNATGNYVFYVDNVPVATNALTSGSASYSNSGLTVAGSPHTIQVVYLGDPNYLTSTNSMTQTVNRGTPVVSTSLSATAITYGQRLTNSTLSGAFTNIAGTAVSGTLTFAQPTLVPNAPSTNVAVIFTPVDTTDYLSVTNTVSVTVNPAASGLTLASSNPTNGYQTAVYFTATVPTNATGSIIFLATNGGFGAVISTNSLTNGQAISLTITSLPRGTNIITAQYAGDSNYIGSTNTLNQIVTNHPPVAAVMTVVGTKGVDLAIALADVATNWTDADGDPISLTGVNLTTTNGVALSASNWVYQTNGSLVSIVTTNSWSFIFYSGGPSVADQISYSINDGQGGTNIGYINIVLDTNSVVGTNSIASITVGTSNVITAYGIPGYTYILERATNLAGPVWVNVATNVAATNGVINAVDTFWDLSGVPPSPSAFYQLKWPSP